jgi:hypothetical protein
MSYDRGTVVLALEPYSTDNVARPFLIVSTDDYEPDGYLGVPLTTRDKTNTYELTDYDKEEVFEPFEKDDNFVNPSSPVQVNDPQRPICRVSDDFVYMVAELVAQAIGA